MVLRCKRYHELSAFKYYATGLGTIIQYIEQLIFSYEINRITSSYLYDKLTSKLSNNWSHYEPAILHHTFSYYSS